MRHSIFFRIFASFCFIIFVLSGLIFFLSFRTIKSHYINTLSMDLKNLAYSLKMTILPLVEEKRFQELDKLVKRVGKDIKTRITVIAPDGRVLADSQKNPVLMENHGTRPEVLEALEKGSGSSLRFSTTVREEMLYVALPIESNSKLQGVVRVSLFLRDINGLLRNLKGKIFLTMVFVTLLSLGGAYMFSQNLSHPIRELVDAFRSLSHGDFNTRVIPIRKDELGNLARSFNEMRDRLSTLFQDLKVKQEELNEIISSLEEGLLVLDNEGRVSIFNEGFRKMLHSSPEGKFYWEIFREPKIVKLIERGMKEKKRFMEELEFSGRVFLCSLSFVSSKEELIIVFHDVSELKKLEKMKKDFVVNVSHELRTPLTAIKGYVETLEEEVEGNAKHYLEIIKKHTERLINIVQDLLLLSELEERGLTQLKEEVNLKEMVKDVFKIFEQKIKEKKLKLNLKCKDEPVIKGDPFKLEQMFINLIDNAIKYTRKGEVSVELRKNNKEVIIEVQDTGIGIPREHLDRIFERFYVVDKSNSKRLGGTGLGLSIVKHIVFLHNGRIDVESDLGKGTKFIITLPFG